jgi:hypothetical protein
MTHHRRRPIRRRAQEAPITQAFMLTRNDPENARGFNDSSKLAVDALRRNDGPAFLGWGLVSFTYALALFAKDLSREDSVFAPILNHR